MRIGSAKKCKRDAISAEEMHGSNISPVKSGFVCINRKLMIMSPMGKV
jgi:hypothetical protein